MLKKLLVRPASGLVVSAMLCSFILLERDGDEEKIIKNELSYEDTRVSLRFGGIEEMIAPGHTDCFRTDIYLSDVDLNNAGMGSHEKIVLKLQNHMEGSGFKTGKYDVMPSCETGKTGVEARLLSLNGAESHLEITHGSITYSGEYPQIALVFDLNLSNGEHMKGSFERPMTSFKYFF